MEEVDVGRGGTEGRASTKTNAKPPQQTNGKKLISFAEGNDSTTNSLTHPLSPVDSTKMADSRTESGDQGQELTGQILAGTGDVVGKEKGEDEKGEMTTMTTTTTTMMTTTTTTINFDDN